MHSHIEKQITNSQPARRLSSLSEQIAKRNMQLQEIIASLFILLFVYTALSKIFDFDSFKFTLGESPLIGKNSAAFVAYILPAVEILFATLLLFPKTRGYGFALSFFIMMMFTAYLSYIILFIPNLPCSCGGVIKELTWNQHLALNILFTVLAFVGGFLRYKQKS